MMRLCEQNSYPKAFIGIDLMWSMILTVPLHQEFLLMIFSFRGYKLFHSVHVILIISWGEALRSRQLSLTDNMLFINFQAADQKWIYFMPIYLHLLLFD